jgi:hypothetical protein
MKRNASVNQNDGRTKKFIRQEVPTQQALSVKSPGRSGAPVPRLYYHNDNTFLMYVPPPITADRFVEEVVGRLLGTQVDGIVCHMFSPGDEVPLFQSAIAEAQLVEPKKIVGVTIWKFLRNLRALMAMDYDPWRKAVETAHQNGREFWAAMRFNDSHPGLYGLRNRFGINHPQYYLENRCGRVDPDLHGKDDSCRHLDYSLPEVQNHRLRQMEEISTLYDIDGLELDFTRDIGHNFPFGMKNGPDVITDYLRRIRQTLDQIGKQRGREVKFGVRVPATPEACRDTGHDVERWVKEGLIDVLTPSVYYDTSCELPFDAFVKMAQGTSCLVYASPTEGMGPGRFCPPPAEAVRASCLNAWNQGVDGINLFNFHHHIGVNHTEDMVLLSEIGHPQTLQYRNKLYMIAGTWREYFGQRYSITPYTPFPPMLGVHPFQVPIEVPVQSHGPGVVVRVPIADDIAQARKNALLRSIFLHVDLCNLTGEDELELSWNNIRIPLHTAKIEPSFQYPWNGNGAHGNLEATFDLTHGEWVSQGDNEFKIILYRRPFDFELPLRLWALRLAIDYNVLPAVLGRD